MAPSAVFTCFAFLCWQCFQAAATVYLNPTSLWHWEQKCKPAPNHTQTWHNVKNQFGLPLHWILWSPCLPEASWSWAGHVTTGNCRGHLAGVGGKGRVWPSAPRTSSTFSKPMRALLWEHIEDSGHGKLTQEWVLMINPVFKNSERLTNFFLCLSQFHWLTEQFLAKTSLLCILE